MATSSFDRLAFRKSSHSTANSNCVELAVTTDVVVARDTKNPAPVITFTRSDWQTFLNELGR